MTEPRDIEAIYELSPMQQGMLFHAVLAPESGAYTEQFVCTIRGVRPDAFERAWQRVVARHAALRTMFAWKGGGRMLQGVSRSASVKVACHDWSGLDLAAKEAHLEEFLKRDRALGIDFTRAPLMRLALIRIDEDCYEFVWTHHHLILDGWSLALVLREVLVCYEAIVDGREPDLRTVRPYGDFIAWLRRQNGAGAEMFWRRKLAGISAATDLLPSHAEARANGRQHSRPMHLPSDLTEEIAGFARRHRLTLNAVVQGAWTILLSRYSGSDDVIFGATVSGRPPELEGAEEMVGLFINTIPVRARVRGGEEVVSWLRSQQLEHAETMQFQHCPLVDVQGWSEVPRPQPLFTNLLVFENYPVHQSLKDERTPFVIGNIRGIAETNYPLTVSAGLNGSLVLTLVYDESGYKPALAGQVLRHLRGLLETIVEDPGRRIADLPLLSAEERRHVVAIGTGVRKPVSGQSFVSVFESQAQRTPGAAAVVCGSETITYGELDRRANQLAHRLMREGVRPESLVGIFLERSPWIAVAIVGILKCGGAWLPLDPEYPSDRLQLILDDAKPGIVLTEANLEGKLACGPARVLPLDAAWSAIASESDAAPGVPVHPETLAYVIYTSGSTGRPKGVMLRHAGLASLCLAQADAYGIGPGSRVLQFASVCFDASVPEILMPLAQGGTAYFAASEDRADTVRLTRLLRDARIEIAVFPPSLLGLLSPADLPDLKCVIAAGERCPHAVAERWRSGRRFVNAYGPTECTVCTSMAEVDADLDSAPPIGCPVANTTAYIVSPEMALVPVGVAGELLLGGIGVARGYLRNPDLTAARFIPDPFSGEPGALLYRSGDLARWRPDGNIDFLGRLDEQVKIRGFRIEPGEVEAALEAHPAVREAAVVACGEGDSRHLAAYCVLRNSGEPEPDLQRHLEQRLPRYMVPAVLVKLDAMPRLPNGKVNRRALPAPGDFHRGDAPYEPPRTPVEDLLCGIWAQVLGLPRAGREDDFFRLGGHSLSATQLISRVRRAFGREIPLRELFDHPTVAAFAAVVESALAGSAEDGPPLKPLPVGIAPPLSFAQERLWFLDQLEPGNPYYNNPALLRLRGTLDLRALERSLDEMVRRHEVLRTSFRALNGKPAAVVASNIHVALAVADLRNLPEPARETEAIRRAREESGRAFDLTVAPLLRASVWRLRDDEHVLLILMHHIVCDGWSNAVMVAELAALYPAFVRGLRPELPVLRLQYGDYAWWQRERLSGAALESELGYWTQQLAGCPPVLDLPFDRPRPPVQSFRGAQHRFELGSGLSSRLRQLSRSENVTLFMTLMAGFQSLLARYTRQSDIPVGTPIANRNRADIEPMIGFFVNTLVLRADVSDNPRFRELLSRVRDTALGAYAHQDVPFEMVVEKLQPQRNLSHAPLFQAMLALNNAPAKSAELPGLTFEAIDVENGTARFDLVVELTDGDNLAGSFEYNTDLFDRSTIARMAAHFERLLEAAAANPVLRVSELPILDAAERDGVTIECNRTESGYPSEHLVHELFEKHAEASPDAVAVRAGERTITYGELDREANRLAWHLRRNGAGRDTVVGLLLDRSPDLIVGALGVLKAGAAYLPLDPSYPAERLAFMLRDSCAAALLVNARTRASSDVLDACTGRVVDLDAQREDIARETPGKPSRVGSPDNLAYVIYTSGSTGRPKGVMVPHRGLCNVAALLRRTFRIDARTRVLQFAPFSFDASVWETFMALANGAALCLGPSERADMEELHRLMRQERITTVTMPGSVLAALRSEGLPDLDTVISAGEACRRDLVAKWAPGRRFVNAYGPTEATICASMADCSPEAPGDPPIGTPLANTRLYVVDSELQPLPAGVPGELCIAGVGLARGYLGQPGKTAESFVPEPFGRHAGSRMYRTGDLARRLPDGQIEFLGRIDGQVKVRGYRVEPAEIEAALSRIEGVRDTAVIVHSGQLTAFLAGPDVPAPSGLRDRLKPVLPDYMIPSRFVTLPALPLNPSGKVDRRALADRPDAGGEPRAWTPPRTATEKLVASVWSEFLATERVGAEDNFFELGGHSLLATQVISRLRQAVGTDIPLRAIFEYPKLEDLARMVDATAAAAARIAEILEAVNRMTDGQVEAALTARKAAGKAAGA